jgi:glycine/D-amino acid oxidase-like deaminating enzyme
MQPSKAPATVASFGTYCRVVICGGGIIGAATAYYLAQQGVGATVIEREALAAAASGKAGGFLALDWNDSSPVGPLAR